jgi:hypothetical protein
MVSLKYLEVSSFVGSASLVSHGLGMWGRGARLLELRDVRTVLLGHAPMVPVTSSPAGS